jgi:Rrf2 family nitric oxide-sensitive transcriptional repressor
LPKSNISNTSLKTEEPVRLTIYTDYSLRLLIYLALKDDGLATIAEVAQKYRISKNHLMKVAYQLGVAGYVETVRGRSGGLRLAKPATSIGLGEVVRHTEPDMNLVPCFVKNDTSCAITRCCVLRRALDKARLAFSKCSTAIRSRILRARAHRCATCLRCPPRLLPFGAPRVPCIPECRMVGRQDSNYAWRHSPRRL